MKENGEQQGCSNALQPNKGMHYKEAIKVYHAHLKSYELKEIDSYSPIYYVGQKCTKKVNALMTNSAKSAYTDANGGANLLVGDHIAFRYEVTGLVGSGTFGRVASAKDHATGALVAIKVINKDRKLSKMARQEIEMMQYVKSKDSAGKYGVLSLTDSFTFRGHTCIVMEQLGRSLYDQLKFQKFEPMSLDAVRVIAARLLVSLAFLWRENIVHCDIKPENILLGCSDQADVKLIDLGSAFFDTSKRYDYVQSRYYRAPEVILGINSHRPIDLWSYACVLCELATGAPIFPGDTPQDQLGCIVEYLGPPPPDMISACRKKSQHFNKDGTPKLEQTSEGEQRKPGSQSFARFLELEETHPFISFIKQFLVWDPKRRVEPLKAMQHPWIREEFDMPSATPKSTPSAATVRTSEAKSPVAIAPASSKELLSSMMPSTARHNSTDMHSVNQSHLASLCPLSPYNVSTIDANDSYPSKATGFNTPMSSNASPTNNKAENVSTSTVVKPAPVAAEVKAKEVVAPAAAAAAVVKPAPVAAEVRAKEVVAPAAAAAAVVKPAPVAAEVRAKEVVVPAAAAAAVVKPAPVAAEVKAKEVVAPAAAAAAVVKPAPVAAEVRAKEVVAPAAAAAAVVKPAPVAAEVKAKEVVVPAAAAVVKPAPVAAEVKAKEVVVPAAAAVVKPAPVAAEVRAKEVVVPAAAAAAVVKPAPVAAEVRAKEVVAPAAAAAAVVKPAPVAAEVRAKEVVAPAAAAAAAVVKPAHDSRRRSSIQDRISQFECMMHAKPSASLSCVHVSKLSSTLPAISQDNLPVFSKASLPLIHSQESVLNKSKLFMQDVVKPSEDNTRSIMPAARKDRSSCDVTSGDVSSTRLPSLPSAHTTSEVTQRRHTRRRLCSLPDENSLHKGSMSQSHECRPQPVRRADPTSAPQSAIA